MFTNDNTECSTKISVISQSKFDKWLLTQSSFTKNWALSNNFKAESGKILKIPYEDGRLKEVILGEGADKNLEAISAFSASNIGNYYISCKFAKSKESEIYKAWAWGNYNYQSKSKKNLLYVKEQKELEFLTFYSDCINFSRDLINSPANKLNPSTYYSKIKNNNLFKSFNFIDYTEKEINSNFPLTYAVGKSSSSKPKVIEITNRKLSKKDKPLVIIGKGVTFDTGGVNIKPGTSMRNMKKDMGGSAIAISLFLLANYFLKKTKIVLIAPIAENAISSKSMRPGDVYSSVSGKSVEIAHTDAEGRLLLADAIEKASSYNPCMIIDFATLTGAARVALGEDLPAYFCNNETFAKKIENLNKEKLRCWRLPLYSPYLFKIKSQVADLSNASLDGMAGSITAALFLQEFLKSPNIPWFHFDTFAWSQDSKGAALQGLDIMSDFLRKNFN